MGEHEPRYKPTPPHLAIVGDGKDVFIDAVQIKMDLKMSDRHALAFASLAICCLPQDLRAANDAYDMERMLLGETCGRDGYILDKARAILLAFGSGVPLSEAFYDHRDARKQIEGLVARALERLAATDQPEQR